MKVSGPKLLDTVDISGTLVTADAMSCQKEIVSAIREHGADYLIGLKANQKSLLWDAEDNLAKLAPDDRYLPPVTLEQGRIEDWKCLVYRNLEGIRTAGEWKDLRAIENNLHWTLDTSLRQDAIKRKHKEAARNLDTVQKTVLLLLNVAMRRHPPVGGKGKCSLADVRRKAADSIDYAMSLLAL